MRILAVYGSRFGQAEAALRRVGDTLRAHGHRVTVMKGDDVPAGSVDQADAVVVAASIVMGKYQGYIRDFATMYASRLSGIPSAFISVSGHAPESSAQWRESARAHVRTFLDETGWRPEWVGAFAGALRYTRYGWLTRWMMRSISRKAGGPTDTSRDFEFTDWDAVERFADELAVELERRGEPRQAGVVG